MLSRKFYSIRKILVLQQQNLKEPFNYWSVSCLKTITNPPYPKHSALNQFITKLCFVVMLYCLHGSCAQVVWCADVLQVLYLLSELRAANSPLAKSLMLDAKQESLAHSVYHNIIKQKCRSYQTLWHNSHRDLSIELPWHKRFSSSLKIKVLCPFGVCFSSLVSLKAFEMNIQFSHYVSGSQQMLKYW